tara:strand:+ start:288 stop:557 length:270 start_codon:yes stop_codon:yes gene_type:complete
MKGLPFTEIQLSNDTYIREFAQSSDSDEFRWHRDYEDRVIVSINKTDWLIQLENKLPQELNSTVFIERGEWHRLIKGTSKLKLKIVKCE